MGKRTQGERAGLSRELVLDAAVGLVDRHGLDGLSMRKLGATLGVEAMTLYHYFPNKAALIDGLVEWVVDRRIVKPCTITGPVGRRTQQTTHRVDNPAGQPAESAQTAGSPTEIPQSAEALGSRRHGGGITQRSPQIRQR